MASTLTIGGATIDRPASRCILNRLALSLDGVSTLEWTEKGVDLPGTWGHGDLVTLAVDGTTVFRGQCVGSYPSGMGRGPIDVGYRALDTTYLVQQIAITAADGTGQLLFNLPSTDDDYVAVNAGLSVGDILKVVFDLHAAALTSAGLSAAPCYTQADLDAITVVPPEPVMLAGRLWNEVLALLATWCNKYAAWIDPATQKICIKSQLALTALDLTLDSDPIVLEAISRDHSECYTQVILRGAAEVEGAYLSLAEGTLEEGFDAAAKAAWSLSDFYRPKDSADVGDITALASTTVTVQSDDASLTWGINAWSGINAEVWAYDPAATTITFSEQRRITANTALTAGGTSILTVDPAWVNAGYSRYAIRGLYATAALTWRKYTIPVTYVAQHLVKRFHHSVPWEPTDGVTIQTTHPAALICWSASGTAPYLEFPATFDVVPYDGSTDGYIVFHEPTVKPFGTLANLEAGGGATDGIPADIKVLVPYSRGAITATKPAASYEGTAYTTDTIERTLYRDYPQWLDTRDSSNYGTLAQEILDTVKNTVVEGSLTYWGKLSAALTLGKALNLAHATYTCGFESMASPIRSVTLDYQEPAEVWVTRLSFSNRMKPFSGDRLYAHPAFGTQANQWAGALTAADTYAPGQQAAALARDATAHTGMELPSWDGPDLDDFGMIPLGSGHNKPLHWASPEAIRRRRRAATKRAKAGDELEKSLGLENTGPREDDLQAGTGDLPDDVFASND